MPGIFFTNAWMLAGLAALSVPVLIHLLLRRKKKRLRFSTVQFFMQQDEQSSQRRKLRNWLLLTLRLLVCTLLVLAFARPFLPNQGAGEAGATQRNIVVVLDRSLSMQANAPDGPQWLRARELTRQILSQLKPGDRAALISCGSKAEVLSEWGPPAMAVKALQDLEPTYGATSLGEGLQQASRLVGLIGSKATSIYVVSDLQRTGCENIAAYPLPPRSEIKVLKVGDLVTSNLAVTDVQIQPDGNVPPHATIVSYSDEDSANCELQVSVDDSVRSTQTLFVGAGAVTNATLAVPALTPGWHNVTVGLKTRDALALDNIRFQAVYLPVPARVLIAESRPAKRSFEEESFFLTAALDPALGETNSTVRRFAPEKVSPDELAVKLAGSGGRTPAGLVVIPGLKQVPAALGNALLSYVQAGGGLLLFLGEDVSANRYQAELGNLLPAQLGTVESAAKADGAWRIGSHDTNTPMFAAFQAPNSGNLALARFHQRFTLTEADGADVVARFDDGMPFILTRRVGQGQVVLVNSSADTSWNDWPKHKTFVPWVHGTAQALARLTKSSTTAAQPSLVTGTEHDLDLGVGSAKAPLKLQPPTGQVLALTADDKGRVRDVTFPVPGVYSLRNTSGTEMQRLAVNVPGRESDLTAMGAGDFQQKLVRGPDPQPTTLVAGLLGSESNQRELWRVLLLSVLVLLAVETVVGNRTFA